MIKTTFYTTIENQVRDDGSRGLLYDHFDDENRAWNKFYTILAAASLSEIPYHAGYLIQDNGMIIGSRVFDRRTYAEPTPEEPEVEPEET